jgi:3-oxoadipate enol-lactonase
MEQGTNQTGIAHVNGTELYYEVAGTGHPFTLMHGLLLDRRSWDDQFEVFAQEGAEPLFSPRQDLLSLLHYLNIDKTYLLGLSGGGTFALDFTLEHPDNVDALILVSSDPSGYAPPMTDAIQTFAGRYYGALQHKDLAGAVEATVRFWTDGPRRVPEQVDAQARARVTTISRQQLERHGDFMAHEQHMIPLEPPAIKRLAEVTVPTLIVVGDEDMPQVIEASGILEQGIAGAQTIVMAGTAHHPHMEKPEEFNHVVLDFLNGLPS